MSDNTRLVRHQSNIYKIKLNLALSSRTSYGDVSFETIESVIRAVLYAEERGKTIPKLELEDYYVSYTKKYWKASEKLGFKQNSKFLEAYPYLLIFTVEPKLTCGDNTNQTRRSTVASSGSKPFLGSNNSCSPRREPFVRLSRLNHPSEELALKQSRSLKRQPVVVLERLNLPVSKKPDKGLKENQLRTSPRRKRNLVDESLDELESARRKRHRDAIADENLPLCRAVNMRRKTPEKHSRGHFSPKKAYTPSGRSRISSQSDSDFSQESDTDWSGRYPRLVNGLSKSPVIPLRSNNLSARGSSPYRRSSRNVDSGMKHQPLSTAGDSQEDSRSGRLRSPRGKSRVLQIQMESQEVGTKLDGKSNHQRFACPSPKEKRKRTSSGFWQFVETIMTPVKLLTRKRSK